MEGIIKKIKRWFGYHNGPVNIYTGRGFSQGAGFDIHADTFEIKRLGIKFVKEVKINVDPQWLDSVEKRLAAKDSNNTI